jgi:hypothetical protein
VDNKVANPEADHDEEEEQKEEEGDNQKEEMLSHLQSPQLLKNLLGRLCQKHHILKDYKRLGMEES